MCKNDCDARPDCSSFEHSQTEDLNCQLHSESAPTATKYGDFQFCAKIGLIYKIMSAGLLKYKKNQGKYYINIFPFNSRSFAYI